MQPANEALARLGDQATRQFDQILESNPFLKAFHGGTKTHEALYRRHILETAIRIRMNNVVDSYALAKTIKDDPMAEYLLAYLHEEYGHDRMFEQDLRTMGLSEQELAEAEPLFATDLLMAFLWKSVEKDGMLPALIWDWLVEWYSARYNPQITDTAAATSGAESVSQARRHLELDQELGHEDGLTRALTTLIDRDNTFEQAQRYVDRFVRLIEMYFDELLDEFDL